MEITNIEQIYAKFDKVGCLTFATVDENGEPQTRIAHLRGYDEQGIYFMTMFTKSFYRQLKKNNKISVCGISTQAQIEHDENGLPVFESGYAIRMSGDVLEVSIDDIKAKNNPMFDMCIKDWEKYNAMVVLCITSAAGDIFDYDFEKVSRENKLERIYISYNGKANAYRGLKIDQDRCIQCGECLHQCSFNAVKYEDDTYTIDKYRCDECGDCYLNCIMQAIKTGDEEIEE